MKIDIYLYKKNRWYQHLEYLIDDSILIQATTEGLKIKYLKEFNYKKLIKKNLNGYFLCGVKEINIDNTNNTINKLHLYNCISIGKILLGMKGIYFSCEQFFNKVKGDLIWQRERQ